MLSWICDIQINGSKRKEYRKKGIIERVRKYLKKRKERAMKDGWAEQDRNRKDGR